MPTSEPSQKPVRTRMRASKNAMLGGAALFLVTVAALLLSEYWAVDAARIGDERRVGIIVLESGASVNPAHQGKLVHLVGELESRERPRDPQLGVEVDGVRLERSVEMYQWREIQRSETEKTAGGTERSVDVYAYEQVWSSREIDSAGFHEAGHDNPPMGLKSATFDAVNVTLGQYRLTPDLLKQITEFEPVEPEESVASSAPIGKKVYVAGDAYFIGRSPVSPAIGDLRVTFRSVPDGQEVTVLGRQANDTFTAWEVDGEKRVPQLHLGDESVSTMYDALELESGTVYYVVRGVALLLLCLGAWLALRPLVEVSDSMRWGGRLVRGGAVLSALALGLGGTLLAIGGMWLTYSLLVGIPLVVLGAGALGGLLVWKRTRSIAKEPGAAKPSEQAAANPSEQAAAKPSEQAAAKPSEPSEPPEER